MTDNYSTLWAMAVNSEVEEESSLTQSALGDDGY